MDNYIQDLFSKDDIGFKPVNDVKDSTKIFVFKLNKFIKDRDGKNINIVFVNVDDVSKIQKTYPNYFLNTSKLLEILSKIILDQY